MLLRALAGVDQLPAFLDREGGRHLGERVLAGLHGGHAHRRVQFPGRGDEHGVDVLAFEHLLPCVAIAIRTKNGHVLAGARLDPVGGPLEGRGVVVADSDDLGVVEREHGGQMAAATCTHPDERPAHFAHLRGGEAHGGLAGRGGGGLGVAAGLQGCQGGPGGGD